MKKVKFSVMCNAIYYGELMIDKNLSREGILEEVRDRLAEVPATGLEWISDWDPEVAVTYDDIIDIVDLPAYDLPKAAVIEISELECCLNDEEEIKDAVVDFLTDEFGFYIKGCNISLEDEGLAKVTNIDWDTDD